MLVHRLIRLESNTKVFCSVIWQNNVRTNINAQFGLLKCFGLKRKYSVLFGLTDNLLATIHENISLICDSSNDKTVFSSGEKDKYI